MNLKKLVKSKAAWLSVAVLAMVLAAATLAQAAPTIGSGATPPSSHDDGRSSEPCANCHTVQVPLRTCVVPGPGARASADR